MSVSEKEKRTKSLKKKLRTKLYFIGIIIAALIIIIVVQSLAWFSYEGQASAEAFKIKVQDAQKLFISEYPLGSWSSSMTINAFKLKAICGDGYSFFKPIYEKMLISTESGVSIYGTQVNSVTTLADSESLGDFAIIKEFCLKPLVDIDKLYISSSSYLSGDLDASEQSSMNSGALSTAHIAAACRVALYTKPTVDSTYTLSCIWIPNVNAHLQTVDNKPVILDENYSVDENGVISYIDTYSSSGIHDYETTSYFISNSGAIADTTKTVLTYTEDGYAEIDGVLYIWDLQKAISAEKFILDNMIAENIYYLKMVIWVDGTDRECDMALLGGKMNMVLRFNDGGIEE